MKIYRMEQRYSEKTGEPKGFALLADHERCDFSGEILNHNFMETDAFVSYSLDYGTADPYWGDVDPEYDLSREHNIQVHMLMQEEPFKVQWEQEDAFYAAFIESDHTTFHEWLRHCRAKTALRLFEEGEIEPVQLDGYDGPEMDEVWG